MFQVWFDYKCAVKRKLRYNKKSLEATGGGPCAQKPLNELEERVANFCNLHFKASRQFRRPVS